jgi:hypothetical protein
VTKLKNLRRRFQKWTAAGEKWKTPSPVTIWNEGACAQTDEGEDDEETLHRLSEDLQDEDCELETATEPREGIRYIFQQLIRCNEMWL